jgi:hypothetical protein
MGEGGSIFRLCPENSQGIDVVGVRVFLFEGENSPICVTTYWE